MKRDTRQEQTTTHNKCIRNPSCGQYSRHYGRKTPATIFLGPMGILQTSRGSGSAPKKARNTRVDNARGKSSAAMKPKASPKNASIVAREDAAKMPQNLERNNGFNNSSLHRSCPSAVEVLVRLRVMRTSLPGPLHFARIATLLSKHCPPLSRAQGIDKLLRPQVVHVQNRVHF